jgi:hypothetical protein
MKSKYLFFYLLLVSSLNLHSQTGGYNSGGNASAQDKTASAPGKLNYQTDLFTGRFAYSIPVQLPPGRNGCEPNIALHYNSSGENTWCGFGWELDLGFIQRETKKGVPVKWTNSFPVKEYDDNKSFTFSLNGHNSALVQVGNNEYRAEIEGAFMRFTIDTQNNFWQVTDKSGNRFYFGETAASRMRNSKAGWSSNACSGTFRWALSHVETVDGDTTDYTYSTINGALYPTTIAYNGSIANGGRANTHTVEFQLEDRTDKRLAFNSGFRVETSKRLTNILVKVSNQLVRRYQLGYSYSPSTLRSMLQTVTVYGANNTDSLPPMVFNYSQMNFGFDNGPSNTGFLWTNLCQPYVSDYRWNFLSKSDIYGLYCDLVDLNGDGLPERILMPTNAAPYTNFWLQLNNGSGFSTAKSFGPIASQGKTNDAAWSWINSRYTRLLDINGDGYPDRVMDPILAYTASSNSCYTNLAVEINNGAGFNPVTIWTNVIPTNFALAGPLNQMCAIENPGYVKMIDMNGDGLPDRLMNSWRLSGDNFTNYVIQFNTGSGFSKTNYFGPYYGTGDPNQWNKSQFMYLDGDYTRLIDINGDGLPDRVSCPWDPSTGSVILDARFTNFVVEFNNGYGFEPSTNWLGVDPKFARETGENSEYCRVKDTAVVVLRDLNGDGLPDRIMRCYSAPYTNWWVQINTGSGFAPIQNFGPVRSQGYTNDNSYAVLDYSGFDYSGSEFNVTLMDINGDGLLDRVMSKFLNQTTNNYFVVELHKGPFPDLLVSITNGMGGGASLTYKPSTQYDNRSTNSPNAGSLLPFPVYTVASVSAYDGMHSANSTAYDYVGGMWYAPRREFHGFASVIVTEPLGGMTTHYFHQSGGRDQSGLGSTRIVKAILLKKDCLSALKPEAPMACSTNSNSTKSRRRWFPPGYILLMSGKRWMWIIPLTPTIIAPRPGSINTT